MSEPGEQSHVASREQVLAFLKRLKPLVSQGEFRIVPRNYEAMAKLGINIDGVGIVLMSLTEKNYSEGPMDDRNQNLEGAVWVFGAEIEATLIYIKIRMDRSNVVCISFHPANSAMRFPHK